MTTWRGLAVALAQRAQELRGLWLESGASALVADERAQGAICGLLMPWLSSGRGGSARWSEPGANSRGMPAAVRAVLRSVGEDLSQTDRRAILSDLHASHPDTDPITRFYESFLTAYDPGERKRRGVFYTPQPVASFVVQAMHECLQRHFGWPDGLAHDEPGASLHILDPAAGTGVFLVEVIDLIQRTLRDRWRDRGHNDRAMSQRWSQWVSRVLPGRLTGYELMPAAAGLANLNVALKLRATGVDGAAEREWVHRGNSLELLHDQPSAGAITVIIGNPPYAISSKNRPARLEALLADYKQGLEETNLNALSDDYVKFFRLAHHLVTEAGAGAIGLVTNNSLLEGVSHRRMRSMLLRDFDEVQVVDLHGSVMRRHEAPAGTLDENVFDIQQGVAITLLARAAGKPGGDATADRKGRVRRADLWGTRRHKYEQLSAGPQKLVWKEPPISAPYCCFRASGAEPDEYRRWPSLTELFGIYSSGIKFRKDGLLVKNHFCRADAEEMLRDMAELPAGRLTTKYGFSETTDWRIKDKRAFFADWRPEDIVEVTYRPFDVRHAFYPLDRAGRIIVRGDARVELMRHVLAAPNIGLIFNRQVVGERVTHFLVSRRPVSHGTFYLGNKGQDYFAPLYLMNGRARRSNLAPVFDGHSPEAALHYLYAVVHSPTYRARYAESLKLDFPRVPLPGGASLFAALGRIGADLVGLHLLEDSYPAASWMRAGTRGPLADPEPGLFGMGAPVVAHGYPRHHDHRVYLNADCWLEEVPEEAWRFQVGGYPVCTKWLKARRGRTLSSEDLSRYRRMVRAFGETIRLMSRVDQVIDDHGGWPRAFAG